METQPVEVTIRLYHLASGEAEVELSIPETSELGRLMADASPAEEASLFHRLRRLLTAELADAFAGLESPASSPATPATRPAPADTVLDRKR